VPGHGVPLDPVVARRGVGQRQNELASLLVNVIRPEINNVEMFKGGAEGKMVGKFSYICAPDCESIVMPGDDNDYNAAIAGQISTKSKEALSSAQTPGQ